MEKTLFDQTQIKNLKMNNRLIAAAVGDHYAVNGHMTEKDFNKYEKLAKGGVSTIITGYTYISDYAATNEMPGINDDSFIPEYSTLTEMAHQNNVNIILQLVHPGALTFTDTPDARILGPSEVENLTSKRTPLEMTKQNIKNVQQAFADAALRAKKAGFDGVELHAAHGFLLNQFLTPYYNKRTDEYGQTDENRSRMLVETFQHVREKVGNDYPILVKINCMDGIENGITFNGFRTACEQLIQAGVDAIEVSGPWMSFKSKDTFYFIDYAEKIAQEKEVPIILVGGVSDYAATNQVLNDTHIDYFAMARPLIADPELVNHWAAGDTSKTKCIRCNGCTRQWGQCVINN